MGPLVVPPVVPQWFLSGSSFGTGHPCPVAADTHVRSRADTHVRSALVKMKHPPSNSGAVRLPVLTDDAELHQLGDGPAYGALSGGRCGAEYGAADGLRQRVGATEVGRSTVAVVGGVGHDEQHRASSVRAAAGQVMLDRLPDELGAHVIGPLAGTAGTSRCGASYDDRRGTWATEASSAGRSTPPARAAGPRSTPPTAPQSRHSPDPPARQQPETEHRHDREPERALCALPAGHDGSDFAAARKAS